MPKVSELTVDTTPIAAGRVVALEAGGTVAYPVSDIAKALGIILSAITPTTSENTAAGYVTGMRWIQYGGNIYKCVNAAAGTWVVDSNASPPVFTVGASGLVPAASSSDSTFYLNMAGGWGKPTTTGTSSSGPLTPVVVTPIATWTPSLANDTKYSVSLSQACEITFTDSLAVGTEAYGAIDLDTGGYPVTWANTALKLEVGVVEVIANAGAGDIINLAFNAKIKSGNSFYHVWVTGTEAAASAGLPSGPGGATHYWPLTSDLNDVVGALSLTAIGSAAVIGTAPYGLSIPTPVTDYALAASMPVDINAAFTVYFAFKRTPAAPVNDHVTVWGFFTSASTNGYAQVRFDTIGSMTFWLKDDSGVGSLAGVSRSLQPDGTQLWKLMRDGSGNCLLKCLNNGNQATGSFGAGAYTVDQFTVGVDKRPPSPGVRDGWEGGSTNPLLAFIVFPRETTVSDDANMRAFLEAAPRSLTFS